VWSRFVDSYARWVSTPSAASHLPPAVGAPDPFAAPGDLAGGEKAAQWLPVSTRLATVRRISALAPLTLVVVAAVVASVLLLPGWVTALVVALGVMWLGWTFWLIGRQVRATGYALRTDDLLVVSGIMFRRLVIVPYGRMQLVDVSRGPIDRHFGLATVQLHTAAATTDATVPGLPLQEAKELRDRLAALGEQRSAGI